MALWDNCQGKWKLANTTYGDWSGNSYTLSSAGSPTAATGHGGGASLATAFNGTSQYLFIANASAPNLQITGNLTISAWVYPTTGIQFGDIVGKFGASGSYGYTFDITAGGKIQLYVSPDGTALTGIVGGTTLAINTWYHVACVYDGSYLYLYVNGVSDATPVAYSSGIKNTSTQFQIGIRTGGGYLKARGDDIAIWNRALSSSEIIQLYGLTDDFVPYSVTDTGTGTDVATGTKYADQGNYLSDTGSGSDAVSYTQLTQTIIINDVSSGSDTVASLTVLVPLLDETGTGTDSIVTFNGALYSVQEISNATDLITLITAQALVTEVGTGTEAIIIPFQQMAALVLRSVHGFPAGQLSNVQYQVVDSYQTIVQSWTSSGVFEVPVTVAKSSYSILMSPITQGTIMWRIQNTSYWAAATINIYESNADIQVSSRASQASINAIPSYPTLSSDISNILTATTGIKTNTDSIPRILGLSLENRVEDSIIYDNQGRKISSKLWLYNAPGYVQSNDHATNLVASYQATFSYSQSGKMILNSIIRLL